jgi:hypothetical protein
MPDQVRHDEVELFNCRVNIPVHNEEACIDTDKTIAAALTTYEEQIKK